MTEGTKFFVNAKKIPYYLILTFLTAGASLILGFLSFGGMYAIVPSLSLAFATFGLSVAYEGEIYLQNIKGAFNKLFKKNHLENYLAKEYLLKNFPKETQDRNCPEFFKDYEKQLKLLSLFDHKQLNKKSKHRKKQVEKTLSDMEKWFALHLFLAKDTPNNSLDYSCSLQKWLENNKQEEWQALLKKRQFIFNWVKAFSLFSALFMTLGTTYLIVEAFSVIPIIAAIPFTLWPIMVLPMALIAGVAYGMLTYNTVTDLINNDTLNKWYYKIRNDLSKELTARTFFIATMAIFLVGIALALTVCTAGTWWTIASKTRPLFSWMEKMPNFVMGVFHPVITGVSTISFNVENIAESMDMVDAATHSPNTFRSIYQSAVRGFAHITANENWLQILNPFRLLIKLTITPLRILLFLGHLVSYALTADRMPGVPQIVSALIAITSEGFEDAHYFLGQNKGSRDKDIPNTNQLLEHHLSSESDHSQDIPSRFINMLALPLQACAAVWDYLSSQLNSSIPNETRKPTALTLKQALYKHCGIREDEEVPLSSKSSRPSKGWQAEHTGFLITKHQNKHLNKVWIGAELAEEKKKELVRLKKTVLESVSNDHSVNDLLENAKHNPVFHRHRLFAIKEEKTATQTFIEQLPRRVSENCYTV